MLPPPYPCQRSQLNLWPLVNKYLELSLLLECNSGLRRSTCAGAPSSSQSHVSYILSHFLCMIACVVGITAISNFPMRTWGSKQLNFAKAKRRSLAAQPAAFWGTLLLSIGVGCSFFHFLALHYLLKCFTTAHLLYEALSDSLLLDESFFEPPR